MIKKIPISIFAICFMLSGIKSQPLTTPLEKKQYQQLSTSAEIVEFCKAAAHTQTYCQYFEIGKSTMGKPIPMLKFQFNVDKNPLKVLYIGQQHGNEPSGKEGLLLLIQKLIEPESANKFNNLELYIIPQLNPDGGDKHQRRNGMDVDLNRDHLLLSQPETQAVHQLFDSIKHHVTADFHEYYPFDDTAKDFYYVKNIDIQMGGATNPNISNAITQYSYHQIIPGTGKFIEKQQYSFSEYTIGSLIGNEGFRYSTVDINDGRQSFGICNTFSFIFEGINNPADTGKIIRRAASQATAAMGLLMQVTTHADTIKKMVEKSRTSLYYANRWDSCCLQMKHVYENKNLQIPMQQLFSKKDSTISTPLFRSARKCIMKTGEPYGYLIPKTDTLLIQWMLKHHIGFVPATLHNTQKITEYFINKITSDTLEDEPIEKLTIEEITTKSKNFLFPYFMVPVAQFKSLLIIQALEPQSMLALHHYPQFKYLIKNKKYPIIRVNHRIYFY